MKTLYIQNVIDELKGNVSALEEASKQDPWSVTIRDVIFSLKISITQLESLDNNPTYESQQ